MSTVTFICQDFSSLAFGGGFLSTFIVVLGLLWYLLVYDKFVDMRSLVPFWNSLYVRYQRLSYNLIE